MKTFDKNCSSSKCGVPRSAGKTKAQFKYSHFAADRPFPLTSVSSPAVKVECGGQVAERECAYAKGHVETTVHQSESLKSSCLRLRPLPRRPGRHLCPWILLVGAAPSIQRNHLVLAHGCLAHRTQLSPRTRLQPLVQAGPAEEVSAHAHHRILGRVQTDVTLEH